MMRIVNLVLLALMLIGAGITYDMKHRAEDAARRVARLNAGITKEKEAIAVLKAERSMLSQPGRLQALIAKYQDHFKLEPFSAAQIATLAEIPMRGEAGTTPGEEKAVADAAGGR